MSDHIKNFIAESAQTITSLNEQLPIIQSIADQLIAVIKNNGTIYSCGNGGSACDSMHLTEELVARYSKERPGIKAQHFVDPGILTCWSNDYSFDSVFERQVQTFLSTKDVLIVFSTSGNSENIIKALKSAKQIGALSIALLGNKGGKAKNISDISLIISSKNTAIIQQAHITIVHILCEIIEGQK